MGFVESVQICFNKYATFKGRARRSEYWWFYLFTIIGSIVTSIIDSILGLGAAGAGVISTIFSLAVIVPTIAVACRRLHDTNRSGWFQLLPMIGAVFLVAGLGIMAAGSGIGGVLAGIGGLVTLGLVILLIVWFATDGGQGDNRFGPSPKYGSNIDAFN